MRLIIAQGRRNNPLRQLGTGRYGYQQPMSGAFLMPIMSDPHGYFGKGAAHYYNVGFGHS
jgi:hypothetical protein